MIYEAKIKDGRREFIYIRNEDGRLAYLRRFLAAGGAELEQLGNEEITSFVSILGEVSLTALDLSIVLTCLDEVGDWLLLSSEEATKEAIDDAND